MFDSATAQLIRSAPALNGVNPELLPQELTNVYAELAILRLRAADFRDDPQRLQSLQRGWIFEMILSGYKASSA